MFQKALKKEKIRVEKILLDPTTKSPILQRSTFINQGIMVNDCDGSKS